VKKTVFIFSFIFLTFVNTFSQSIRKSFTELTASEKSELQAALYQLRDINNDGIVSNNINAPDVDDLYLSLAKFHKDFFRFSGNNDAQLDIHFNLPYQINIQIFFSWHRYQMFELEQALQVINPKLSLAYWNSSVDNDVATLGNTLFGPDLLGPFDSDWGLNRVLGSGTGALPTPTEVTTTLAYTDFATSTGTTSTNTSFSNRTERDAPHVGAHIWTGGVMPTTASPGDPVFYFHHSWVDKLWADWEAVNPGASSFIIQSMIRYDGTFVFNGNTLPLINPNDIINTRSLGVFYAENGLAELDNYAVTNTHNAIENFYYQYTIEAGNNFTIPTTKSCEIESVNMIVLEPGFFAENGANFTAKIDTDDDINTLSRNAITQNRDRYNPIDFGKNLDMHAYEPQEESEINTPTNFALFPNPFKDKFTLSFDKEFEEFEVTLFDAMGKQVYSKLFTKISKLVIDNLDNLSSGAYILKVSTKEKIIFNTNIIKK